MRPLPKFEKREQDVNICNPVPAFHFSRKTILHWFAPGNNMYFPLDNSIPHNAVVCSVLGAMDLRRDELCDRPGGFHGVL